MARRNPGGEFRKYRKARKAMPGILKQAAALALLIVVASIAGGVASCGGLAGVSALDPPAAQPAPPPGPSTPPCRWTVARPTPKMRKAAEHAPLMERKGGTWMKAVADPPAPASHRDYAWDDHEQCLLANDLGIKDAHPVWPYYNRFEVITKGAEDADEMRSLGQRAVHRYCGLVDCGGPVVVSIWNTDGKAERILYAPG